MSDAELYSRFLGELLALKTCAPDQFAYLYKLYLGTETWVYEGHKCLVRHGLCDEKHGLLRITGDILHMNVQELK